MVAKQRSKSTKQKQLFKYLYKKNKDIFNKDVFSFYQGIIENIDLENGKLSVRVPSVDNILCEDCKFMMPCATDSAVIYPMFKINTPVIIGFEEFNLANPIVFGYILDSVPTIPIEANTISTINGNCKITIKEDAILLTNGTSSITINASGISFTGPSVTSNGENLSIDDVGEI